MSFLVDEVLGFFDDGFGFGEDFYLDFGGGGEVVDFGFVVGQMGEGKVVVLSFLSIHLRMCIFHKNKRKS